MIDSDRLDAFVAFAEALSFTAAARSLHLSQPALHVKIRKLSEELGVPLYRRAGRTLVLTPEGRRVLAHARDARARDDALIEDLRGLPARPVVLAAGEGALLHLLGPAIREFRRQGGALRVLTRDRAGTVEAVRMGEAQLGVTTLDAPPDDLAADVLARSGLVVAVPRTHRMARRRTLGLGDLAGCDLVLPLPGRPLRDAVARALSARGIDWTSSVEATGWELQLHFASLGLGLAIVNDFCRMPKGLVARPLRGIDPVTYHVIRRRSALPASVTMLRRSLLAS